MPWFDKTGPLGNGPKTGRGLGPCGRGYSFRKGLGRGIGFGAGYSPPWTGFRRFLGLNENWTREDEKEALLEYKNSLKEELEEVEKEEKTLNE
jgi:hypothetical protein